MKRFLSLLLTLGLLMALAAPASAARARAAVMRLQLAEGSVTIQDSGGNSLSYVKNMRLYSGYTVSTGSGSSAYILLDDTKAVKLDRDTTVTIKKSGRKLLVKLKCGQLTFNVTAPLEANETMEIRTSSMVLGVRGSSGVVNLREVIFVTGHGVVYSGEARYDVAGGQAFRPAEGICAVGILDLPALYLAEVRDNSELQEHIRQEGLYPVDQLIAALPYAEAREADELADALAAVREPPAAESVIPAFASTVFHTVTWRDGDRVLKTEQVEAGTVPVWSGEAPGKEADDQFVYTFSGWTPEPAAIDGDASYTAVFKADARKYTVTWHHDDGSVIDITSVAYGEIPAHKDPVKADTAEAMYAFIGWDKQPAPVTGNADYTAVFETTYDFSAIIPRGTDEFYYEISFPTEGDIPITTAKEGEEFTFFLSGAHSGVSLEILINGTVLGGKPLTFGEETEGFVCTFLVPKDPVIEIRIAAGTDPSVPTADT